MSYSYSSPASSPPQGDGPFLSTAPALPPKDPPYYEGIQTPSPSAHEAPEVVEQWVPYNQPYDNRPLSPYSANGSTLISPTIPPFSLNDEKNYSRPASVPPPPPPEEPKICGIKKRWFYIILLLVLIWLLVVALALGLGLGLGLKKNHSDDGGGENSTESYCRSQPQYCIGGAINKEYFTKTGAFNGSGIALAGESWNNNEYKIMTIYFQHWTGDIRWTQLTAKGEWIGGSKSEVVAFDAKNGTPISTVAYAMNDTSMWHIFYVDQNNTLRQKTNSNVTNIWADGALNSLDLKVLDSPSVGMQACWYGNFYGDSDFKKFPTASGENNTEEFDNAYGMHIWFAIDETTFKQYGWYQGLDTWVEQTTWTGKNGHAGVGCYSWLPGTTTYAMFANQHDDVEFWWKDTNTTLVSEDEHPINSWVNASDYSIDKVWPSTSLGYTTYFYAQMEDQTIQGYNISFSAENTTAFENTLTVGGTQNPIKGLGGTHLTCTAVWDKSGGASLYVFYQTRGDDVTMFVRDLQGGQWSQGELPIPDD